MTRSDGTRRHPGVAPRQLAPSPTNVDQCAWLASRNTTNTGVETAGMGAGEGFAGSLDTVDVRTRDSAGSIADGSFHVAAFC